MTEKEPGFTRRRVLGGLLTVGGASAAAGAGTMAVFTDSESTSGNSVQAGTLDLKLGGEDKTVTFLDVSDIKPGDEGDATLELDNSGSLTGTPTVEITDVRDYENGYDGAESNGQDGTLNDGELDEYLEMKATIDSALVWDWQTVENLTQKSYSPGTTIDATSSNTFTLSWWLPEDTTMAQGDSVEIDLTFALNQTGGT